MQYDAERESQDYINRSVAYGLPEPLFEEFGDGIKVTMFRKVSSSVQKVSSDDEKLSSSAQKLSNDAGKLSGSAQKINSIDEKIGSTFDKYIPLLRDAEITDKFIENIEKIFAICGVDTIFGQVNVQQWLMCSKSKSTNVMNAMKKANIIKSVSGAGFGKYQFIELYE